MMKILVDRNSVVLGFGQQYAEKEDGAIFFDDSLMGYNVSGQKMFEVEKIPDNLTASQRYCYTEEKGFYPNPDYVEPKPYTREQYDAVLVSLIEEGRL